MIKRTDLNLNIRKTIDDLQNKIFIIQKYLFLGNSLIHNNITYKIDESLNVYTVSRDNNYKELYVRTIVNSNAYVLFMEIATTINDYYYKHIKSVVCSSHYCAERRANVWC